MRSQKKGVDNCVGLPQSAQRNQRVLLCFFSKSSVISVAKIVLAHLFSHSPKKATAKEIPILCSSSVPLIPCCSYTAEKIDINVTSKNKTTLGTITAEINPARTLRMSSKSIPSDFFVCFSELRAVIVDLLFQIRYSPGAQIPCLVIKTYFHMRFLFTTFH